ncbi:MAG: hypothetical protein II135_03605 [Clostridia bacterium]|nr:hypothetical protein [Clostridia bacterium]
MKKILSFVLIVALVSALFTLWTSAAETPAAMTGASVTAEPGETVAVDVTLENNPGFMYMHVFVSVDEGLEIVSIDNASAAVKPDGMTFGATSVTGGYNVTADHSENITGDGVFFTVNVKVGENASGTLNVNLAEGKNGIFNYDEDDVAFEFTAGEVEVEAGPEEPALIHCNMDIFQVTADVLSVQGWAGANYPANNLGYKVDGGDPIFDGIEFRNFNTEQEGEIIKGIAGEFAFRFASVAAGISLADVEAGEHTITLVVRVTVGADNAVLDMASETFTISHEAPDPSLHAYSFDNIFIEGDNKTPTGNAGGWIAENENFGDVQNIGVRGWAWVDNGHIGQFGYQIDDAEPVFSAAYLENRADLGGVLGTTMDICNGFQINPIDVSGLADGAHVFKILLSSDNDTVITVTSFNFTVERPEPPVEYSLLNVSYDELKYDDNTLVNGSADKWIHNLEDPSVLDFQVGTVSNITVRGWVRISEDVADIAGFGYSIDGGAVVEGDFIQDRAAELASANFPGAQGFCIVVPVSDLAVGEHSIDAYVIAADGTEIKIVKDRSTAEVQDIRQVGVTFNVTEEAQPVALQNFSFDTIYIDGETKKDGEAGKWIEENPNFGDAQTIGVRGWAWIVNGAIESFGYSFDGGDPVFDTAYIFNRPDVQGAFNVTADEANGFEINPIDVSGLESGDHTCRLYVKATDGSEIEFTSFAFTIERPVPQDPAALHAMSFNTVFYNGAVWCDVGDALTYLGENPLSTYLVNIGLRGWAWIDNSTIESFGYCIDGGERIFNAAYIEQRADVQAAFGVTADVANGFNVYPVDLTGLEVGAHTMTVFVKAADGTEIEIVTAPFTMTDPNTVFFDPAGPGTTGWWMNPVAQGGWVWTGTFTTPYAFDGVCALIFANPEGSTVDISVLDENGNVLETKSLTQLGDGTPLVLFDNAYPAGTYTLKIESVGTNGEAGWFVIGSGNAGDVHIEVGGNCITNENTLAQPYMLLRGAVPPEAPVDPAALHGMSFNTVWVDGTQICDVGDALGYLAENPINGDISTLAFRGWAWIDNGAIESFGYAIDGGEPVFDAAFIQDRADVQAAFGVTADVANGFNIQGIDVSGLGTGAHTATLYVKATDGSVLEIVEVPFSVERPAPALALLNVSYDELKYDDTQLFSGSVDKSIFALEDKSILDFEEGTIENITVRGWVRISENIADIAGFGYSIDGGEVVEGDFIQDRAAELANANFPGAQGFCVVVPVADLAAGEHSIDVYVIAADGTQIKVVKDRSTADVEDIRQVGVTFNVTESAVVPQPTSDIAIVAIAAVACVAAAGVVIGKKKLEK